jgi:hypothetical protein
MQRMKKLKRWNDRQAVAHPSNPTTWRPVSNIHDESNKGDAFNGDHSAKCQQWRTKHVGPEPERPPQRPEERTKRNHRVQNHSHGGFGVQVAQCAAYSVRHCSVLFLPLFVSLLYYSNCRPHERAEYPTAPLETKRSRLHLAVSLPVTAGRRKRCDWIGVMRIGTTCVFTNVGGRRHG